MSVHPATPVEIAELRWFENSGRDIEAAFADALDVLCNWCVLGVHPHGTERRVYVIERSSDAVACIDGDGTRFGRVSSPSTDEAWTTFLAHHHVRT